ncbi:MAG TPA: hypothetical protein VKE70_33170 [Candidatus Solibacter sp.]|nr:hypothetical protein [Candidatus Solibacter sp.]
MTCQEFWNSMPELGGLGEAGERNGSTAAQAHLNDCSSCANRMARQRELAAGLRAVAAGDRRIAAPSRVASRLRAAFRAQVGIGAAAGRVGRAVWTPAWVWAVACAAVLALALVTLNGGRPAAPRTSAQHLELASLGVNGSQSEYEGFIPLPNASHLADTEEVNVVHVEVPRSAMIALGLDVAPERASELVAADVMLGPDGLARAVRFLDEGDL